MNEESIFHGALKCGTPEEQAQFLDRACQGDAALRAGVESLLEAHRQTGLDPHSTLKAAPDSLEVGSIIGHYRLRERIGEGGMGTVYIAEQERPVRRKVALKVIKLGMDTRQVVARFEAERQALALMDHPFISKVLDAGATDTGRPYFVMELVRGAPITEYCRRMRLTSEDRLRLFVDVCQAVQHAHQKGIIHRDLKPSNILVSEVDGRPVPKVIDFGIAKATGQHLTEHSLYTAHAQLIGTPLYMSPEQTALSGVDVDTRSDVYSLGVMLYELLTGTTPVSAETLSRVSYDELRRIIREDAPPLPSARVSTLNSKDDATVVGGRHSDAARLSRELRGELDWIVMRALEKDRNRRYESASALASDVERYLNDEPVLACPPSWRYRAAKYARRHKVFLTTAGLVTVALLTGMAAALWQADRANVARQFAEDRQRDEAAARAKAEQETLRARTNFEIARQAVARMLTRVAAEHIAAIPGMKEVREQLLTDAATLYSDLLAVQPEDAETYRQRAQVHDMLRAYDDAIGDLKRSTQIDPGGFESHLSLARLHFIRPDAQNRNLDAALKTVNRAVSLEPGNPRAYLLLARIRGARGEKGEARLALARFDELTPESSKKHHEMGVVCWSLGDKESAIAAQRKAVSLDPNNGHAYIDLGVNLANVRRDDEALEVMDRAVELMPELQHARAFMYVLEERARIHLDRNDFEAALQDTNRVIELYPGRSYAYKRRAVAHFRLGRPVAALADLRRAIEINPQDPSALTWIPAPEAATHTDPAYREDYLKLADETFERSGQVTEALDGRAAIREAFLGPAAALSDLRLLLERDRTRYTPRYVAATLALSHDENQISYRQACREAVHQFGSSSDPELIAIATWTCLLAPDGLDDYTPAIVLASRAVEAVANDPKVHVRLGALQMRAGRLAEARTTLLKAHELADHTIGSRGMLHYCLALTEFQLRRESEAFTIFREANERVGPDPSSAETGPDQILLKRLRSELESQFAANADRQNR